MAGGVPVLTGRRHPAELPVYERLDFRPVAGSGAWLADARGRRVLDLYAGHAVATTGHAHPRVVEAVATAARSLLFYSNALPLDARDALVTRLARLAPAELGHVFLVNAGAEANDHALALARRLTGRAAIVAFEGGFHGRTLATLAASGIARYRDLARRSGGGDLAERTRLVPHDDPRALERAIDDDVAAVIVEPVQGLAGARAIAPEVLEAARAACRRHAAWLIFDEVQTGCGRCGAFTAAQAIDLTPDAVTLAKGLGSGLPIGALLIRGEAAAAVGAGDLGTTFGGGPVPCAAAAATLDVVVGERLAERALERERALRALVAPIDGVERVSGRGLLLGLRLDRPAREVQRALLARDVLTGTAIDPAVLRLAPPLTVSEPELERFATILAEVMR